MSNNFNNDDYNSEDIVKKEARGLGDRTEFDEVQEILGEHIITQRGTAAKERYYIPRNLIERFNGATIYFNIPKKKQNDTKEINLLNIQ